MDANTIIQIVSSLGFPIVMCGALFWYMVKQREAHKEETDHHKRKYKGVGRTDNVN